MKSRLTKFDAARLEKLYGVHNFCYMCGSRNFVPIRGGEVFDFVECRECRDCGASDLEPWEEYVDDVM